MKRKGFTLIELLAVIVILAIIALIATPIVLNIIENTKEEANERSIDMYATGVKNSIAKYQLKNTQALKAGNYTTTDGKTLTHKTDNTVFFDVEYDGNVVCETIMIYENGNIYLADCKVNEVEVEYIYGTEPICTLADDSEVTGTNAGAKYLCKVKDEMEPGYEDGYIFYVLGNNLDGTTNLIMFANINEYGEPVDSDEVEDNGFVDWSEDGSTENGPVTAMVYLDEATSEWKEELRLNETYTDEGDRYGTITLNGKARLPKKSEVEVADGVNEKYVYLVDYMDLPSFIDSDHVLSRVGGYWTLASATEYCTFCVWQVGCDGTCGDCGSDAEFGFKAKGLGICSV